MEEVQSRRRQSSKLLEPESDLVLAFLLGATGAFFTALATGLLLLTALVAAAFFTGGFLTTAFLIGPAFLGKALEALEDETAFAFGILKIFVL